MSAAERPLRVFFALWPDATARRALDQAAQAIHARCGGRVMRARNIHLTLVFVGDVPSLRLAELGAAAAAVAGAAVEMTVDRAVFWPRQRIAWVGPTQTPAALARLVTALEERVAAAGFAFDRRPYVPHVTLVRDARCRDAPQLAAPIAWSAREFVLAQSTRDADGAAYDLVGRWPLGQDEAPGAPR